MKGIIDFIKGSYIEFTQYVTWPKWADLQSATIIIAIFTVLLAIFLFGVDTLFSDTINALYRLLR